MITSIPSFRGVTLVTYVSPTRHFTSLVPWCPGEIEEVPWCPGEIEEVPWCKTKETKPCSVCVSGEFEGFELSTEVSRGDPPL